MKGKDCGFNLGRFLPQSGRVIASFAHLYNEEDDHEATGNTSAPAVTPSTSHASSPLPPASISTHSTVATMDTETLLIGSTGEDEGSAPTMTTAPAVARQVTAAAVVSAKVADEERNKRTEEEPRRMAKDECQMKGGVAIRTESQKRDQFHNSQRRIVGFSYKDFAGNA